MSAAVDRAAAAATAATVRAEWSVDRMDLAAYLRRIGHAAEVTPTATTLAALHRAHLSAIVFENLDIVLGHGIDVELGAIQDKLVRRCRGGYCYEHNLLFAAALEQIGFSVERLLARVGTAIEQPRARTHLVLRVHAETGTWLCDVGFGSGLLDPISFAADGPQAQAAWSYALAAHGPALWELRERRSSAWVTAYRFDDQRQHFADVVVANHFSSTFPRSPFVGQLVAVRKDANAIHRLLGRTFTVTGSDWAVKEDQLDDRAVADTLRDVFGLSLEADQRERLLDTLPALGGDSQTQ